jgi:hypothetical protein
MRKPHPMHIKNLQHRTFLQVVVSCSFQGKLFRAFHFPRLWQSKPQSMCRFNRAIDFISDNHNIRPCALSTASSKTITTYAHVPCQQRHRWQSQHTTRGPVDSVIDDNHNIPPGAISTAPKISFVTITTYAHVPCRQRHRWQSQHTPMCPVNSVMMTITTYHQGPFQQLQRFHSWRTQHTSMCPVDSVIDNNHNIPPGAKLTAPKISFVTITTYVHVTIR